MTQPPPYSLHTGELPLLVSVPHAGTHLPPEIEASMTPEARALPDTDWYVDRLYAFCVRMGAGLLVANYSRYVIDLNRAAADTSLYPGQFSTGLCPSTTFGGQRLYTGGRQRRSSRTRFPR